jgi:hypothetical protein
MYGALREANISKIQPPWFADFRVEIVPNSTHFPTYDALICWFSRRNCTEFYAFSKLPPRTNVLSWTSDFDVGNLEIKRLMNYFSVALQDKCLLMVIVLLLICYKTWTIYWSNGVGLRRASPIAAVDDFVNSFWFHFCRFCPSNEVFFILCFDGYFYDVPS